MIPFAITALIICSFCAGYFLGKKYLRFCNRDIWEYGTCNGFEARRHKRKKNVQFVIFCKGEQAEIDGIGHTEDKWVDFESSWWPDFTPSPEPTGHDLK